MILFSARIFSTNTVQPSSRARLRLDSGTRDFTWERYIEVAKWIGANVPDEEVKYGSGFMAQNHNALYCGFSNVMAAYGADYFYDADVSSLGLEKAVEVG